MTRIANPNRSRSPGYSTKTGIKNFCFRVLDVFFAFYNERDMIFEAMIPVQALKIFVSRVAAVSCRIIATIT